MAIGKSKYADRLSSMQGNFKSAQKQAEVMDDGVFPEGTFTGAVTAKLKESKSGNLMVARMFVPTQGELIGVPTWDNLIIEHDNLNVAIRGQRELVRFLSLCGYEFNASKPQELEAILEELTNEKPIVNFKVRHTGGGDGQNPFVNVDVLEYVGASPKSGKASSRTQQEEQPSEVAPTIESRVVDFCMARGIEVNDPINLDSMKANILYEAPITDLDKDEKELMKEIGIDPSKKPSAKKTAAPAPASKKRK